MSSDNHTHGFTISLQRAFWPAAASAQPFTRIKNFINLYCKRDWDEMGIFKPTHRILWRLDWQGFFRNSHTVTFDRQSASKARSKFLNDSQHPLLNQRSESFFFLLAYRFQERKILTGNLISKAICAHIIVLEILDRAHCWKENNESSIILISRVHTYSDHTHFLAGCHRSVVVFENQMYKSHYQGCLVLIQTPPCSSTRRKLRKLPFLTFWDDTEPAVYELWWKSIR